MLAEANAAVPRPNLAEVREMIDEGNVLIVDVRDALELASGGKLKGAVSVSCGMLVRYAGIRADPASPSHNPVLQKDKTVLICCGSGSRVALERQTLRELGYQSVFNAGGFKGCPMSGSIPSRRRSPLTLPLRGPPSPRWPPPFPPPPAGEG